jgi:hypothetical protein
MAEAARLRTQILVITPWKDPEPSALKRTSAAGTAELADGPGC